jgi:predicted short-subunit dehydrogenase-like oxidoreductase (DUF2520 family)
MRKLYPEEELKAGFIGAGKVGCSLGKYLSTHGVEVAGYYDRDTEYAEEAARFTGSVRFASVEDVVRESDMLFITVPDGVISSVFDEIKTFDIREKYICHCSGSISAADAFVGIESTGAYKYSVHPLFAVSDKFSAYRELPDVFFTIEGQQDHLEELRSMLTNMGLTVKSIDPAAKTLYHAAAVMASNLVTGLLAEAANVFVQSGAVEDTQEALAAMESLIRGNVEHVLREGPAASLTGPVERGDDGTVRKHLAVLRENERKLYTALSQSLVALAEQKHPDRSYETIKELLSKAGEETRNRGGNH